MDVLEQLSGKLVGLLVAFVVISILVGVMIAVLGNTSLDCSDLNGAKDAAGNQLPEG